MNSLRERTVKDSASNSRGPVAPYMAVGLSTVAHAVLVTLFFLIPAEGNGFIVDDLGALRRVSSANRIRA